MKRWMALALSTVIFFGALAARAGAAFADITDPATQTAASMLQGLGLVNGYNDGKFHPNDKLTRAQFCKMAVLLSGVEDVTAYTGYTIFPDVRAGYWGRGYINAAVRSVKIIAGYPDGTFRPDTPISFAQAVTMLMRLLGYEDKDVGANWPYGYLDKAATAGLTKGLSLKQGDLVSRGIGVRLFYNALFAKNKEGKQLIIEMGATEVKTIVLQTGVDSADGTAKGLVTTDTAGFYPYRSKPDAAEGSRGTLLIDKEGYVLTWTPDVQTKKDFTVKEVNALTVTGTGGERVSNIPTATVVYQDGEPSTWKDAWIDIQPGHRLRCFFTKAGVLDYILWSDAKVDGTVTVLDFEPQKGQNPLPSLGLASDAKVYKNGVLSAWADLRQWDVCIVNASENTVAASDFRIIGIFESASPNREAPDTVTTLGGQTFPVLPDAREALSQYKYGDAVTFLFTQDKRVADVKPARELEALQPGLVTGDDSVTLSNGVTVTGTNQWAALQDGSLVLAAQRTAGRLSLRAVPAQSGVALNLQTMKAGSADIAPYAVFYDRCADGGRAAQVALKRLPANIPAAQVLHVRYDTAGRADFIVLKDVTGDGWLYGDVSLKENKTQIAGEDTPTTNDDVYIVESSSLTVSTQAGSYEFAVPQGLSLAAGGFCAVADRNDGVLIATRSCVSVTGLHRADFTGNTGLKVSGRLLAIPEDMKVFVKATGKYITVAEARVYTNDFTVYLDKAAADGGQLRRIVAL